MDFDQPYLTKQIIAYIGNKRKLLELIYKAIEDSMGDIKRGMTFVDVFSGSGIVSRLGKYLGLEVFSNDWESYTSIINRGLISIDPSDIPHLFGSWEEFDQLLYRINNLPDPPKEDQYIARYYSPRDHDIDKADFRKERLFYTRENGLIIDRVRNFIEREFPDKNDPKRDLLLSLLLYEAATHTNTSGVFKAFHKGFGGHGRDAMKRILSPITLSTPQLIDSEAPTHIYQEDANQLVKRPELQNLDIAYLDPPYNQHQYGSNYHMLNTIALWDKIPAPLDLNEKGVLKEKAAIRKDWKKTRSPYCYCNTAIESFTDLLGNLTARYILISYSTDGIIPFETMKEICLEKGRVSLVTNEYTKYRGGKQSNSRKNGNIEFILVVEPGKRSTTNEVLKIDSLILKKRVHLMFKQNYSSSRLKRFSHSWEDNSIVFALGKKKVSLSCKSHFELIPSAEVDSLTLGQLKRLLSLLEKCVCVSKVEELDELLTYIEARDERSLYYIKQIPRRLKKLAHKKNRETFYNCVEKIAAIKEFDIKLYSIIEKEIERIKEIGEKRFTL